MLGFDLLSTAGTARALRASGLDVVEIHKVHEGRPNVVDAIKNGEIALVINTPFGRETRGDGYHIRTAASNHSVPSITTLQAAQSIVQALEAITDGATLDVCALQDFPLWQGPAVEDET
jgi:carbamoyl-phosphate synthase large subunit